jgi:NADPH:quinone reductase-like Zn-dependent oxidoreductase
MRNVATAAPEGRIVQISTLAGPKTEIDLRHIMQKRLTLTGSTLRNRPIPFKAELARALEETVWPIIEKSRYKPVIDKIFPLDEVVEAHRRIESGEHFGKIILTMTD